MVEARVDRSWIFVVTVAALVLLPISTSTQAAEEEGRIQITFSKSGHGERLFVLSRSEVWARC
jgi:hypothetical protein